MYLFMHISDTERYADLLPNDKYLSEVQNEDH